MTPTNDSEFDREREFERELEHSNSSQSSGAPLDDKFLEPPSIMADIKDHPRVDLTGWVIEEYALVELVARGGQGTVYRAYNETLNRDVAFKVFHETGIGNPEEIRQFESGRIQHKNVVPLFAANVDTYSNAGKKLTLTWVAMEFVQGKPLHDATKDMKPHEVLRLFLGLADGLCHVHSRSVWHRDIKPGNALVVQDKSLDLEDRGRWIDFDLAQRRANGQTSDSSSGLNGTLHYKCPESLADRSLPFSDQQDLYSLGLCLYRCLAGTDLIPAPTGSSAWESFKQIQAQAAAGNPQALENLRKKVDSDIVDVIAKAVATDPKERYESVAKLRDDLQRCIDGDRPSARRRPRPMRSLFRWSNKHRLASVGIGLVLFVAVDVGIGIPGFAEKIGNWQRLQQERLVDNSLRQALLLLASGASADAVDRFAQTLELDPGNRFAVYGRAKALRDSAGEAAALHFVESREPRDEKDATFLDLLQRRLRAGTPPSSPPEPLVETDREFAALLDLVQAMTPQVAMECASRKQLDWIAQYVDRAQTNVFEHPYFDYEFSVVAGWSQNPEYMRKALATMKARHPNDPTAAFYKARVLCSLAMLDDAKSATSRRSVEEAIDLMHEASRGGLTAEPLRVNLATAYQMLGKYDEARIALGEEGPKDTHLVRMVRGDIEYGAGKFSESARHYSIVVLHRPNNAAAHFGLGSSLGHLQQFVPSSSALQRAHELVPDWDRARHNLVACLLKLGDSMLGPENLDRAEALYRRAEELAPGHPATLHQFSVVAKMRGNVALAIRKDLQAIDADPDLLEARLNLFTLYCQDLGDFDAAVKHIRAACEAHPAERRAHLGTVQVYAHLQNEVLVQREFLRWLRVEGIDASDAVRRWLTHCEQKVEAQATTEHIVGRIVAVAETAKEGADPTGMWRLRVAVEAMLSMQQPARANELCRSLLGMLQQVPMAPFFAEEVAGLAKSVGAVGK